MSENYKSPYKEIGIVCQTASPKALKGVKEKPPKAISSKERKRMQRKGKRICPTCWGRLYEDGPTKGIRRECRKCKGKGIVRRKHA